MSEPYPDWPFNLDVFKAVQAIGILLKMQPNCQANAEKLISILYLADRESIKETGSPITGDAPVAVP